MARLQGKTALITGGNSGIGLATARLFLREGADVAITGRNAETLAEAERELEGRVLAMQADVSSMDDLDRMYATLGERFGHLDVLFANAGVATPCPLEEFTEELFDRIFDINAKGSFFTVQKALDLLRPGASVILNASIAQYTGVPGMSAYGSSKAAVRAMGRLLAADLVPRDVRVNVVTPGPVRTPIWARTSGGQADAEAAEKRLVQRVPMARMGEPEELAEVALFLASSASSYMTGQEITVDGGVTELPAGAGQKPA